MRCITFSLTIFNTLYLDFFSVNSWQAKVKKVFLTFFRYILLESPIIFKITKRGNATAAATIYSLERKSLHHMFDKQPAKSTKMAVVNPSTNKALGLH